MFRSAHVTLQSIALIILSSLCTSAQSQTWHPLCANGKGTGGLKNGTWQQLNSAPAGGGTWKQVGNCINRIAINLVQTADAQNLVLSTSSITSGYVPGNTDVTLTINTGVVVGSTFPSSQAAFSIDSSWTNGDTVTIVNNGYIVGYGGYAGYGYRYVAVRGEQGGSKLVAGTAGAAGGPAISLSFPATIYNNNVIGGGGGGGGGSGNVAPLNTNTGGGGGGAGSVAGGGNFGGQSGGLTAGGSGNSLGGAGGNLGANGVAGGNGTYPGLAGGSAGACTINFYGTGSIWKGNGCYGAMQ